MENHPRIVFKDGPTGRRAALAIGPDVWEVIRALREIDERGDAAVPTVAELLTLSEGQVRLAMRYYADHTAEIDAQIQQNDKEAAAAYREWEAARSCFPMP